MTLKTCVHRQALKEKGATPPLPKRRGAGSEVMLEFIGRRIEPDRQG